VKGITAIVGYSAGEFAPGFVGRSHRQEARRANAPKKLVSSYFVDHYCFLKSDGRIHAM
jgi:hypothetical protein